MFCTDGHSAGEEDLAQAERITIFDTTLRDGEQSPGCSMNVAEKVRMAHQLDRLGVDIIEGGFPIASEGDFEAVRVLAREIRRPVIAALARSCPGDVERAWRAVEGASRPRIHTFLATSDIHLQHKLKISRRQCLEQARDGVKLARSLCKDVQFSAEDASRTDINFLCEVLEAVIEAGATTLNIPDTVGFSVPHEFAELIQTLRRQVRGIEGVTISVHCHDDLGLSVANSLAAIGAGARQVECTVNGIGERAGNTSLEELIMVMRVRAEHYPYETAAVAEQLFPSSQLLSEITGVCVQPHKAIVGRNAFAHEAGIHQDGMIKDPSTYEIIAPQSVGAPHNSLVLGKHSGRNALRVRYEKLGFSFERAQLDDVYRRFVALADKIKTIEDGHLLDLVRDVPSRTATIPDSAGKTASTWMAAMSKEDQPAHLDPADAKEKAHAAHAAHEREGEQEDYLWGV
ncbi:MAG: 2-isopropylmalate synthase [Acidobacteriia bacterium]|nr:2-isopropylmalate synthase [Terriglobia bacterium]